MFVCLCACMCSTCACYVSWNSGHNMGPGNGTQVLYRSSKCSYPVSHLFSS